MNKKKTYSLTVNGFVPIEYTIGISHDPPIRIRSREPIKAEDLGNWKLVTTELGYTYETPGPGGYFTLDATMAHAGKFLMPGQTVAVGTDVYAGASGQYTITSSFWSGNNELRITAQCRFESNG